MVSSNYYHTVVDAFMPLSSFGCFGVVPFYPLRVPSGSFPRIDCLPFCYQTQETHTKLTRDTKGKIWSVMQDSEGQPQVCPKCQGLVRLPGLRYTISYVLVLCRIFCRLSLIGCNYCLCSFLGNSSASPHMVCYLLSFPPPGVRIETSQGLNYNDCLLAFPRDVTITSPSWYKLPSNQYNWDVRYWTDSSYTTLCIKV